MMNPSQEPTLIMSDAKIRLVTGRDQPTLEDETRQLLHYRLKMLSLIIAAVHTPIFLWTTAMGEPHVAERAIVWLLVLGWAALLWSRVSLSFRQLACVEAGILGTVLVHLMTMTSLAMWRFAEENELASIPVVHVTVLGVCSMLILAYGMFMPHNWRHFIVLALPIALVGYAQMWILESLNENIAAAMDANRFQVPVPLTFGAVLWATIGAYTLQNTRRESFKSRQFHHYVLGERFGEGGMGEIYRAEHRMLKRPSAIKVIHPDRVNDEAALARFEREVKAAARLTHANTVEIYDYGRADDGSFYYVMELLPGKNLWEVVEDHGPLPAERAIHFLRQICDALAEAHSMGLIHRDVKPQNILATHRGGVHDVAKLLDFGLVKAPKTESDQTISRAEEFSGSPLFMAPEQASNFMGVDARADVYALGAVGYFLITGQPPFERPNAMALIMAHALDDVPPPSSICADVPEDLEQVVMTCLGKKPEERYPDVIALRNALMSCERAGRWTAGQARQWWREVEDGESSPEPHAGS
ncbi:MAG: serine/threonine protein kinase [Planctomycetales bacterium]